MPIIAPLTLLISSFVLTTNISYVTALQFHNNAISRDKYLSQSAATVLIAVPPDLCNSADTSVADIVEEDISKLIFERQLGKGSFKTVYLVSSSVNTKKYALAVERLKGKRDSREAMMGISVAQKLKNQFLSDTEKS
jgi:serine/threonine protein kinase